MRLKILLPFEVFLEQEKVLRVTVETQNGSYGFLPKRLDCVAAIAPGILTYEDEKEGFVFLALDEGVMVKRGASMVISARRATRGENLKKLRETVKIEFSERDEREKNIRWILKKMESNLILSLSDILS